MVSKVQVSQRGEVRVNGRIQGLELNPVGVPLSH